MDHRVQCALQKSAVYRDNGPIALSSESRRECDRVLLGNPNVKRSICVFANELTQASSFRHGRSDRDHTWVMLSKFAHRIPEGVAIRFFLDRLVTVYAAWGFFLNRTDAVINIGSFFCGEVPFALLRNEM